MLSCGKWHSTAPSTVHDRFLLMLTFNMVRLTSVRYLCRFAIQVEKKNSNLENASNRKILHFWHSVGFQCYTRQPLAVFLFHKIFTTYLQRNIFRISPQACSVQLCMTSKFKSKRLPRTFARYQLSLRLCC